MISLKIQRALITCAGLALIASSAMAAPAPPLNVKFYGSATVGVGGTTTLDLTINNPGTTNYTALTGSDILPADQVISTPNGLLSACTPGSTLGTLTAVAGTNTITIGTSTILAGGACTVQVNVTGTAPGALPNTFNSSDAVAGTGNPAVATLVVLPIAPPTIAKAFGAPSVPLNGTTSMTITITAAQPLTNVNFADTLPAGLVVATPNGLTTTCTGVATATAGSSTVSLTGATFAAAGTCTVTVNVVGITAGTQVNSVTVSDAVAGSGNTATATLVVVAPPTISKVFGATSIDINGSTSLTFTLANPNAATALTGIAFTDTLPAGLVISTPNGLTTTCGGTITAVAGTNTITLTGAVLAGGASCTISLNVTATSDGTKTNTTSTVTSINGGTGLAATAAIIVLPIIDGAGIYQLRYLANLNVGDSYVNLTNAGTLNGFDPAGRICVNVYTFDPAEELISCCACPVTPNGLNSLSARNDLISNTLTPGVPTSITVKLVASVPLPGNTCNPSAPTSATVVRGMRAWATTLHLNTSGSPAVGYQHTETPFSNAELSVSELTKLTGFCAFIQANGSGFGICKSCRFGALGAQQQ